MLRFWLVCFGILFVMVELWEWLQQLTLPFPLCVVGGISLAIASNLNFYSIASHCFRFNLSQNASDLQNKQFPPFSQN
ncbi:MAG: hypothetical protein BRC33_06175 [Cyanobacteria bacterium SW_9_44_58]|nr:MAG: hypothetical protein BRC33_06175 [Cyanobacteria bacterium SW_9_44_58]